MARPRPLPRRPAKRSSPHMRLGMSPAPRGFEGGGLTRVRCLVYDARGATLMLQGMPFQLDTIRTQHQARYPARGQMRWLHGGRLILKPAGE